MNGFQWGCLVLVVALGLLAAGALWLGRPRPERPSPDSHPARLCEQQQSILDRRGHR